MGVYSLTKSSIKNWVKYPNMMAGSAYLTPASDDLITQTVLASSAASLTFDVSTLAAQGYKHLQLRIVARSDSGTVYEELYMRVNGDSGSNYVRHSLQGDGTSVTSNALTPPTNMEIGSMLGNTATASSFGVAIIDILDFASTSKNKTFRSMSGRVNSGQNNINLRSGLWMSTAAITSLTIDKIFGTNWITGSRFSLYASKG